MSFEYRIIQINAKDTVLNIVKAPKQYSRMLLMYASKINETIVRIGIMTINMERNIYKILVIPKRDLFYSILNFILHSLSHKLLQKQNVRFNVYA